MEGGRAGEGAEAREGDSRMVRKGSPGWEGGSDCNTSSIASSFNVCSAPHIICSSRVTCIQNILSIFRQMAKMFYYLINVLH